jgi:hypothetical protein
MIGSHTFDATPEPPLGAHITTPRRGYTHHGIYVGHGRVVQYGGLSQGLRIGPVEEVSLERFTHGHAFSIKPAEPGCFAADEVIRRARSRLGECRYDLLTNNCEHFCNWCLRAEPRSYQVDRWRSRPAWALVIVVAFLGKVFDIWTALGPLAEESRPSGLQLR